MNTRGLMVAFGCLMAVLMAGTVGATPGRDATGTLPETITAPRGVLPAAISEHSPLTHSSYQAALDVPEILASVPCTCGCMAMEAKPHRNNLDCYIDSVNVDGSVTFTTHGVGCGICQLITRDAVEGAAAGLSGEELTAMVLERYGPQRP